MLAAILDDTLYLYPATAQPAIDAAIARVQFDLSEAGRARFFADLEAAGLRDATEAEIAAFHFPADDGEYFGLHAPAQPGSRRRRVAKSNTSASGRHRSNPHASR